MDEHFGSKAKRLIGWVQMSTPSCYSPICNPLNPQPNVNHHGRKPYASFTF